MTIGAMKAFCLLLLPCISLLGLRASFAEIADELSEDGWRASSRKALLRVPWVGIGGLFLAVCVLWALAVRAGLTSTSLARLGGRDLPDHTFLHTVCWLAGPILIATVVVILRIGWGDLRGRAKRRIRALEAAIVGLILGFYVIVLLLFNGSPQWHKSIYLSQAYCLLDTPSHRPSLCYLRPSEGYTGVHRQWYRNGQLADETQYESGRPNGQSVQWYRDGTKLAKGTVLNGKYEGTCRRWSRRGMLTVATFRAGRRYGLCRNWDSEGTLRSAVTYRDGKRHGEFTLWHANGAVAERGTFNDSHRDGMIQMWDHTGRPTMSMVYENGKLIQTRRGARTVKAD